MKIEIKSEELDIYSGEKEGRKFTIRNQFGYVQLDGKPYPIEVKIRIDDQNNPFPPGQYEISEKSFYINKYQQLAIGTLILTPLSKVKAA